MYFHSLQAWKHNTLSILNVRAIFTLSITDVALLAIHKHHPSLGPTNVPWQALELNVVAALRRPHGSAAARSNNSLGHYLLLVPTTNTQRTHHHVKSATTSTETNTMALRTWLTTASSPAHTTRPCRRHQTPSPAQNAAPCRRHPRQLGQQGGGSSCPALGCVGGAPTAQAGRHCGRCAATEHAAAPAAVSFPPTQATNTGHGPR